MPEIAISNLVINGSDVIFDVMGVTDEDGVIILPSLRVEFFNVDVSTTIPENTFALGLGDSEDITFTDILLPYNGNFVIRIRSNIDLQDGEGLIENYLFFEGTFVYTTR